MTLLYLVLNRGGPRSSFPSAAGAAGAADEDIDLMRIDNRKTKMEFTAAPRKVIQWLVDDWKMNHCRTELQVALAAAMHLKKLMIFFFYQCRLTRRQQLSNF
jgi:hypothetical protein